MVLDSHIYRTASSPLSQLCSFEKDLLQVPLCKWVRSTTTHVRAFLVTHPLPRNGLPEQVSKPDWEKELNPSCRQKPTTAVLAGIKLINANCVGWGPALQGFLAETTSPSTCLLMHGRYRCHCSQHS